MTLVVFSLDPKYEVKTLCVISLVKQISHMMRLKCSAFWSSGFKFAETGFHRTAMTCFISPYSLTAFHDTIAATVHQCRRLIIILSPETKYSTDTGKTDEVSSVRDEQIQLCYEQRVGLYDALTRNDTRVILVEIGERRDCCSFYCGHWCKVILFRSSPISGAGTLPVISAVLG